MLVNGFVKAGFEPVQEAFANNFTEFQDIGAACTVIYKNEIVVDSTGHTGIETEHKPLSSKKKRPHYMRQPVRVRGGGVLGHPTNRFGCKWRFRLLQCLI